MCKQLQQLKYTMIQDGELTNSKRFNQNISIITQSLYDGHTFLSLQIDSHRHFATTQAIK